jgi:hypothetical protein
MQRNKATLKKNIILMKPSVLPSSYISAVCQYASAYSKFSIPQRIKYGEYFEMLVHYASFA